MPTAVSLFSGCGGSDLGLHQAGFEILLANDILRYARDVYEANLPETDFRLGDVSGIKNFPQADLLAGCYPCQGFSQGGARDPGRKINYLYREFDRALRLIRPKAFIVENVSGMRHSNHKHLLRNQIIRYRLAGYRVSSALLSANSFGVAQQRNRVFIVGIRADIGVRYEFPTGGEAMPKPTIRTALEGMNMWPEGEFNAEPFHWYYMSRNRRRDWDEPSGTIVARDRHVPLHPISPQLRRLGPDRWEFSSDAPARRFSYRECAVLQGFPKSLRFPDSHGMPSRYKVIGNAVPPPLFKAVSAAIPEIW